MKQRGVIQADVCVVGAGIVGLAHAFAARARGLTVAVLERDDVAVGASVRNFGHVFVSAMADGPALDHARSARERWLELSARAGLDLAGRGTVVVARHEDELAVLEAVAGDPRRGAQTVTAAEIAELAPIPTEGVLGGLHGALDVRVDPRRAVAALAALLAGDGGATVRFGVHVHAIEPGSVRCAGTTVRAPLVIVCPGPHYDWLAPELVPPRDGLTRCKLQMLRVAAPDGRRYVPALLTGLSLLRYPAFTAQPGFSAVRDRLAAQFSRHLAAGVHLIVTQLPDGDLLLGDTHEYGDAVSPFSSEVLDELLLADARRLLGVCELTVRERWQGVYPWAPGDPFAVWRPAPGVAVVEITAGIGMTTALGFAPRVLDELTARCAPPVLDELTAPCAPPAAPLPSGPPHAGYGS